MKVSNETKVGALAAVSIVLLILGYTYIRGITLFDKSTKYYATFQNVAGLDVSDDVMMNGMEVGRITSMDRTIKRDSVTITVGFEIDDDDLKLPVNSEVRISVDLLSSVVLELVLGDSLVMAESGHVFAGTFVPGIQEQVQRALEPVIGSVTRLVANVDSVVARLEVVFDPEMDEAVDEQMRSIIEAITNIRNITRRVDELFTSQSAYIKGIVANMKSVTDSLEANKGEITQTIRNIRSITDTLASGELSAIMADMNTTIDEISQIVARFNDPNNSLGKMLSDKELYDKLVATLDSFSKLASSWAEGINFRIGFGNKEKDESPAGQPSDTTVHH